MGINVHVNARKMEMQFAIADVVKIAAVRARALPKVPANATEQLAIALVRENAFTAPQIAPAGVTKGATATARARKKHA